MHFYLFIPKRRNKLLLERKGFSVRFSKNGILPWATDESYTNVRETYPRYEDEMTDSQLLYLSAAEFMADLAGQLSEQEDAVEFRGHYETGQRLLMERLWLPAENYFAFARAADDDPAHVDTRPACDALLRRFWLHAGTPNDATNQ